MLHSLFTRAPLIAVLGAVLVFAIVASAGLGLEWPLLLAAATGTFAVAEAYALWYMWRQNAMQDRHFRQIRFIADRFQAMVRTLPGGYCLFTPQGLLREEHGVSERLGVEKISHLDELIAAVKNSEQLLDAFKQLQVTGESFDITLQPAKEGVPAVQLLGRRFRIGREGPHVDMLWLADASRVSGDRTQPTSLVQAGGEICSENARPTPTLTVSLPDAPSAAAEPATVKTQEKTSFSALDRLPLPVWIRAVDLKLILCNEAYAKALDSTCAKVIEDQQELLPPATKGKSSRLLAEQALAQGKAQSVRRHVVVAGQRRLLELTEIPLTKGRPQKDSGSQEQVLLGYAVDVTVEEEKDAELRRHLAAHHEVLEHLGTAISVYGPDTRLEFYNRAYQRLWEAPESFLDTKPAFSEVIEDLRARRRLPEQVDFQKYKRERLALFTSLLEPHEDVIYLPDGTSLRVIVAQHPLGGLIFVHENVTDQLALETSYNTLMAVQRETIDHLAEGIAVFGPDGKLRLWNAALARLWRWPEDVLKGAPHVADLLEASRELLDTKGNWSERKTNMVSYALDRNPRTGRIERTDKVVVEFLTVPLPDGSVLNSFLDVTDTVRVEQALRASNAALAAADRLKSDFVANVSYQLRTPLNTIIGFAEILSEQYFGKLNERQMEYTTTIRAESEKLSRLINDVLDLATIEAGRMVLERHPVDVADLLNAAKQMTAEWARQQSLDILIDCPSDIGVFEVDESRLKQVLFNLIGNAIKYTPAGGQIALAAMKQDRWIVISVLDTGIGIPEDDRDRVFGKFEKTNTHLRQSGAGLGLSLVKSFVELHGGRVEIFSDPSQGTRVSCFLPQRAPVSDEFAERAGTR